jgi:hypothetical protein
MNENRRRPNRRLENRVESRIERMVRKLADPSDKDDKRWVRRRLSELEAFLRKKQKARDHKENN